jgi:hypothetical protein
MNQFCMGRLLGEQATREAVCRLVLRRHEGAIIVYPGEPLLALTERRNQLASQLACRGGSSLADADTLRQSGFVQPDRIKDICLALEQERANRASAQNLTRPEPEPDTAA